MAEMSPKISWTELLAQSPMPVSWDDLAKLKSGAQWTVATTRDYLSFQTSDPWADYWKKRQSLTEAMKTLGFKPVKKGTTRSQTVTAGEITTNE